MGEKRVYAEDALELVELRKKFILLGFETRLEDNCLVVIDDEDK